MSNLIDKGVDMIIQEEEEEANKDKPVPLVPITEIEGCKNVPEPKWRVEGLVPAEGVTYFAGNSNSMKTFTAIYVAQKIASGEPVFNKFNVIQSPVIYIDEENGKTIIFNRAKRLRIGHNSEQTDKLYFLIGENLRIDLDSDVKKIRALIDKTGARVIIVDSLVRCMLGDENSSRDVSKIFLTIKKYCLDIPDLSFIIIHHFGKKSTSDMFGLRGSSDLAAMASMVLTFNKAINTNYINVKIAKNRLSGEGFSGFGLKVVDIEEKGEKIGLRFNYHEQTDVDKIGEAEAAIIQTIQETPQNWSQLVEQLKDDYSTPTIRRAIDVLVEAGTITKKGKRGVYKFNPQSKVSEEYLD